MGKNRLTYEYYFRPCALPEHKKDKLVEMLRDITKDAWADFGDTSRAWLNNSEYLVLVRDKNECVAFDCKGVIDGQDLLFISSMVKKGYQKRGITKRSSIIILRRHIAKLFLKNPFNLSLLFRPIFFVFRTPNPILYTAVLRYHPYPDILGSRKPEKRESYLAEKLVERLSPSSGFDKERFIIKKALKNPDLFYGETNYPKSPNSLVNDFFKEQLNFKHNQGDLLVVVARFTIKDLLTK